MTTSGGQRHGDESWTDLCALAEVPDPSEGGKYVRKGDRSLAVFREGEVPRVVDDTCPHAGGSLGSGHVDQGTVICPRHAWCFDIRTGLCPDNAALRIGIHPARVVYGRVQAILA